MNGGINKIKTEVQVEMFDRNTQTLTDIIQQVCRALNCKEKARNAKLYSGKGLEIVDDDIQFIKPGDVFYVALDGEEFNNCAILDEYTLGEVIGRGGYGLVRKAVAIKGKREVAIKFMDIGDKRKSSLSLSSPPSCFLIFAHCQIGVCFVLVSQASQVQQIFNEAQNLKKLRHKNIIELY